MKKVYNYTELREKLTSEHDESCVYRGQNMEFPGPLFPSMYRPRIYSEEEFSFPSGFSKRKLGTDFRYSYAMLNGKGINSEEESERYLRTRELKRLTMGFVRNALGYCLAEAMFQQAGWESEGLDVTGNFNVASFFALFGFNGKKYFPRNENPKNEFIIYRWRFPKAQWNLSDLNTFDYFNRPPLFPTKEVIRLFETVDTEQEFIQSVNDYREAIGWHWTTFDLDKINGKRPFELLKLPKLWVTKSRIIDQDAFLLFPDSLGLDEVLAHYSFNNPAAIQDMKGGLFLEDLSIGYGCEKFYFTASPNEFKTFESSLNEIYPEEDMSHQFIFGWGSSFNDPYVGGLSIPIAMHDGVNYLTKLHSLEKYSSLIINHEYRYNR